MIPLVATLLIAMSPAPKAEPVDYARLISAISQLEQGAWGKPGGICNISYAAWSDRSPLSYVASANEAQAMPVYVLHLEWLATQLSKRGVPVNAQTLGTCWRWGLEGARRRKWVSDNGERTKNLYDESK